MRLLSLELQGFKSFPEKTIVRFDRGMTVVVGPNGSGKSNISDAIRWVLGEISSKSMRGTKMEDVIFGGTDKRSPMGFAEVSLTIDNRDPDNRLPIDYDEVTVTRRYYRAGESEYMINRKPVRLKDITEMFMNTGLGRTGYSMVNQGKSTEIISQKSDERRIIFEEAAGISKYRHKKNEAERKLKETDENLVRVCDIKNELESRVAPLEKEAERAKKYLDLFERKKEADVSLWLYDVDSVRAQMEQAENEYKIAEHELEMADDTLASLETQSEKLYAEEQENKLQSGRLERQINEAREERYRLDTSYKVHENEITHLQEQSEQAKQNRTLQQTALQAAQAQGQTLRQAHAERCAAAEAQRAQCDEQDRRLATLQAELSAAGDAIDDNYADCERLRAQLHQIELSFSSMEASRKAGEQRKQTLLAESQKLSDSLSLYESRMEASKQALAELAEKEAGLQASLDEGQAAVAAQEQSRAALTEECTRLRIDLSSKQSRIDSLRRMEELFEGYSQNIKFIMSAAKNGQLKGVHAPISRLITVAQKYSTAIETALGQNMQNIVVDNEQTAKDAISLLKRSGAGRATFYPLTSVKGTRTSDADYRKYEGFIGVASTLLTYDPVYTGIMDSLLGRTLVFDDLDHATAMAKATGFRIRTVTLDGQIINAGGSFTGGSTKQSTGLLTRSAESERLSADIKRIEARLAECQAQMDADAKQADEARRAQSELQSKLSLLQSLKQAEDTQYQILLAQTEGDRRQAQSYADELAAFDRQSADYEKQTAALRDQQAKAEAALAAAMAQSDSLEQAERDKRAELQGAQSARNELFLQLSLTQKEIETATDAVTANDNTVAALQEQIDRAEASIAACREKLEKIHAQMNAGQSDATSLAQKIEQMEKERAALLAESLQYERRTTELRERIKDRTRHRDRLFEAYTRADAKRTQIIERKDKLANVMWEEYGLTYTAATELSYPAVTEQTRPEIARVQTELKNKLRALGSVNVNAIEEYREVKERYDFLSAQWEDLEKSKQEFLQIIFHLEEEMRTRFSSVLEDISQNFKKVFVELFGGGHAELKLTDPENVLESGIEINVAPPGKIIKSLSLLSGGEQSFVAIALLFAILNVNPTPFCVLDEVEAALDEVNVERVADYAKRYSETTQFIFITHRRGTMEAADVLYGVTMAEQGVSKILSLNVSEVEQKTGIKL